MKNKCAPPYKIAEFDIMFGDGISSLGCMLDAAESVDVVQRKGSWYSFGDQKLGQGRDKTMAILADNKEMQRSASCVCLRSMRSLGAVFGVKPVVIFCLHACGTFMMLSQALCQEPS